MEIGPGTWEHKGVVGTFFHGGCGTPHFPGDPCPEPGSPMAIFAAYGRAIGEVLELHRQDDDGLCMNCGITPWPCATVRAITRELGESP